MELFASLQFLFSQLVFLCALGRVYAYAEVTFTGRTLRNHSYVNVGIVGSLSGHNLQCHTDLSTCCEDPNNKNGGDWHFPDGRKLSLDNEEAPVLQYYYNRLITLYRPLEKNDHPAAVQGMYFCKIETKAVHRSDRDKNNFTEEVGEIVYVGLYSHDNGK